MNGVGTTVFLAGDSVKTVAFNFFLSNLIFSLSAEVQAVNENTKIAVNIRQKIFLIFKIPSQKFVLTDSAKK